MSTPTDYLAAERTFLAWIRTALSLMGFGFVVARFGLFLQQMHAMEPYLNVRSPGLSLWFGTALIALGIVVSIASTQRHLRLIESLNNGSDDFKRPSRLGIGVAIGLAGVGIAMAIYLLSVRN